MKTLYCIPLIILIIFIIAYIPLVKCLMDISESQEPPMVIGGVKMHKISSHDVNQIMRSTGSILIALTLIMKRIFSAQVCGVSRKWGSINIILYIIACITITSFAYLFMQ